MGSVESSAEIGAISHNSESQSDSKMCDSFKSTETSLTVLNDGEDSTTESLPAPEELIEEPHDRSDGSDSGLGSEIAEERTDVAPNNSNFGESDSETSFERAGEEDAPGPSYPRMLSTLASNLKKVPTKSSLKRKLSTEDEGPQPKVKKKRGITFDSVTVFYFPRAQGFTCVPSQGGSTLGMGAYHSQVRKFSIVEHANEQRRIHRQLLQQLTTERSVTGNVVTSSSEDSDSEDEISDGSESEMDLENFYFLQPVPTKRRRALLRAAGVRKIDTLEKDECRNIRSSREFCGCGCKGYCDPDTCSCSQAGIKCQVDRLNFPCGCTRDNCGNSSGRIEFNPVRVRTHFIHTLMRLELEKKQEDVMREKKDLTWMNNERLMSQQNYYNKKDHQQQQCKMDVNKCSGSLLRDISLSAHIEVENCVNNGSFTNLHYGAPGEGPGPLLHKPSTSFAELPAREDSLDLYTFRENYYGQENDRKQYQSTFSSTTNTNSSNHQGFPFDLRFSSEAQPTTFAPTQSGPGVGVAPFPAAPALNQYPTQFHASSAGFGGGGEFTTNAAPAAAETTAPSHPTSHVFNPYAGIYGNFQQTTHTPSFEPFSYHSSADSQKETQYTNLNTVGANSKLESFCDNLLLNNRYSYNGYEESNNIYNATLGTDEATQDGTEKLETNETSNVNGTEGNECEENFGEIIKKSMVETVSA